MSSAINVEPIQVSITSIWLLQPDYISLRRALESKGYTLRDESKGSMIKIATKGSIEILTNIQRRTIRISSETSTKDVQIAYEDIEQIYRELGIEESNLWIYEFIGSFSVTSTKSPLEIMQSVPIGQDILRKIGSIMDVDMTPLGLDLSIKGGSPTSTDWLRLKIDPLYVSHNKKYHIRATFRGKKEEVFDFTKKIEKRIKRIIEKLEGVT